MNDSYENTITKQPGRLRRMLGNSTVRIVLAGIILLSISVATYAAIDPHRKLQELEDQFTASTQKVWHIAGRYNIANLERCEIERALANQKLSMHYGGDLELEIHDLVRVSNKAQWECTPGSGAVDFIKNL